MPSPATLGAERGVRDEPVGIEAGGEQRAHPAVGLLPGRQVVRRPGDEADTLVAELEQVSRRELAGRALVDADRRHVERVERAVDEDEAGALVDQPLVVGVVAARGSVISQEMKIIPSTRRSRSMWT